MEDGTWSGNPCELCGVRDPEICRREECNLHVEIDGKPGKGCTYFKRWVSWHCYGCGRHYTEEEHQQLLRERDGTVNIHITQIGGPNHDFASLEEYERFLRTTEEELVHLQEYVTGCDTEPMWLRFMQEANNSDN